MGTKYEYSFKRGDDLYIPMRLSDPNNNGASVDITGWTIESQVRYSRKLIADLSIEITNAAIGEFIVKAVPSVTQTFPARPLKCDIQFTRPSSGVISSQTFTINVEEDVTHAD